MSFKTTATIASFGGKLHKLTHDAVTTKCQMAVNIFLPPQAKLSKVPVLFFLSGLTCTGDNCAEKGFFQSAAAEKGIAIVYPDTSPSTLLYTRKVPLQGKQLIIEYRRAQDSRWRWLLRLWQWRWFLHRCNRLSLVHKLQNGILHHQGATLSSLL